jgi:hypothetical protein
MVTITGSVGTRSGESLDQFELRHFELQTSVYDTSQAKPARFSVVCYFESGKRWQKVKVPSSGSNINVTAKIVGRTAKSNRLALRVLDLSYLPKQSTTPATPGTCDFKFGPSSI